MRGIWVLAVLLGMLFSGSAFADWQVQYQDSKGSWQDSYTRKSEEAARSMGDIECTRRKAPLRIVDTTTGEQRALFCDGRLGKITDDGKPVPVVLLKEPEISKRAGEIRRVCEGDAYMGAMLDCGCIEQKAKLELGKSEARVGNDAVLGAITRPASQDCVDRKGTYDWAHAPCMDIMKRSRPNDLASFCHCISEATAESFLRNPLINTVHVRRPNEAAMKQCGLGKKPS
jgi:hypothetical protein